VGKKKWPGYRQPSQGQTVPTIATSHPSVSELHLEATRFEGPLPPPEQLAQYQQISPAFAERVVQMAENEQNFRHADIQVIRGIQQKIIGRGQVFGFIISLAIIAGGILLIMSDKPTSGFISILAGVSTVAGPYFYRTYTERKQKKN
jgi:uncharacterized membrane protein